MTNHDPNCYCHACNMLGNANDPPTATPDTEECEYCGIYLDSLGECPAGCG